MCLDYLAQLDEKIKDNSSEGLDAVDPARELQPPQPARMTIKPMRTTTAMAARKSLSSIAADYRHRARSFLSGNRDQTAGAADTLLKDARRPHRLPCAK